MKIEKRASPRRGRDARGSDGCARRRRVRLEQQHEQENHEHERERHDDRPAPAGPRSPRVSSSMA